MIPDNILEEPGIDKVGYQLAARLIQHLDELERTDNARLDRAGVSVWLQQDFLYTGV